VRRPQEGAARSPTLWHVDVTQSSKICLADPAHVTLWRPDSRQNVTLRIAPAAGTSTRSLDWRSGQSTLAWPVDLPVTDGAAYRLSWDGATAPTAISFKLLPAKPTGLEDTAAALIRN